MSNKDFFDDMMDINRDGKFDGQDMFLNQMIYNEVMKNEKNNNYSTSKRSYSDNSSINSNDGCVTSLVMLFIAAGIIGFLILIATCFDSCNKSSTYRSSYSYSPRKTYSSYSSKTYSSKRNSYSTSSNTNTYKSKSLSQSKSSDPYNAKSYYHADDFYEDYYDDFWDYEEAEDYFNEHND